MDLFLRCEKFIKEKNLIEEKDRILVAVSGGPDSIFLLHFLLLLKEKFNLDLKIGYIHHHLRKQAEKEFQFVKEIAKSFNLPFYYRNIKIDKKKGIEKQAREKRYKALYQIAKKTSCNKIATGHTLDDNVESILLNLLRGTGLAGLCGILPEREIFKNSNIFLIRPILVVRKREIEDFLKREKIKFYIDRSNLNLKYRRNLIRHKIIPYLEEFFPSFSKVVGKMSFILQDDYQFIKKTAEEKIKTLLKNEEFNVKEFTHLHISVKRFIIHILLEMITGNPYRSYNSIENLRKFIEEIKADIIPFSLIIEKVRGEKKKKKIYKEIEVPGKAVVNGFLIESQYVEFSPAIFKNKDRYTGYFDADKIKNPVIVRNRKVGDRFQPLGLKKEKKLSRFLIDKKIPPHQRDNLLVFQSGDDIMWICGVEISEKFKVTAKTKKILKIQVKQGGKNA